MKKIGENGVTLVELLILIAIIGIMAIAFIMNFSRFRDNQDLRSAALEVEGDIAETRSRALANNREYRITFSVGSATYVIEECSTVGMSGCGAYNTVQTKTLPSGSSATSFESANFGGFSFISFQLRGTSSIGTVVVQNSNGSKATVTTNITARTYVTYTY